MRWLLLLWVPCACASAEAPPRAASHPVMEVVVEPEAVAVEPEAVEPEAVEPEPAAPAIACDATAVAAARTALQAAPDHGVHSRHLADCRPEHVTCVDEHEPLSAADSCRIVAVRGDGGWGFVVALRPATGAPLGFEIWIDDAGEVGRVDVEGSTWGVVDGVRIEGQGLYKSHTHGGEAAWVAGARFEVVNERDEPVTMELVGTRWLTGFSCELPREERARPKLAGIAIEPGETIESKTRVEIPAGATKTVLIGHEGQAAYMAWCDRFATAAIFEVDGKTRVEVIAEHRVVRRQPLRREW